MFSVLLSLWVVGLSLRDIDQRTFCSTENVVLCGMIILVDARKVIWACGNFAQSPVRIWKTPGELSFLWSYNGHVHCSWSSGDSLHKHSCTLIFSVYDVWMSWWYSVDCSGQLRERQLHWRAFVDADKTASDLVKEMEEKKMVLNRKVCLKHLVVFVRSLFTAFHLVNVCIIFIHTSPRLAHSWQLLTTSFYRHRRC